MAKTPGALFFAHMRDGPMIRIRLPGGIVSASQMRVIADLAEKHGNDRVDLTNHSNFQLRGLNRITYRQLKRKLGDAGLLPDKLWADRLRNILADPLMGPVDTRPVVKALDEAIQGCPVLKALYPKFGFLVDSGTGISALGHDVGLVAENGGFRLSIAGQITPLWASGKDAPGLAVAAASAALSFPAPKDSGLITYLKKAIYRDKRPLGWLLALFGGQENRFRRLQMPIDRIIERIGKGTRVERPMAVPRLSPSIGIVAQQKGELAACGFGVPNGRLDKQHLLKLAEWSEKYGDGTLRLSPWHVVFIPNVQRAKAEALLGLAGEHGFITSQSFLKVKVSVCSGVRGCRGAKLDGPAQALDLIRMIDRMKDAISLEAMDIHISGCPKGCAHRGSADILALEREDASGYYLYRNSTALRPDIKTRVNGVVEAENLPQHIFNLIGRPGEISEKRPGNLR